MTQNEYRIEEVRSDPGSIGAMDYMVPAYKILEIKTNRLSREGWKIIMMDVINPDLILAVFERIQVELDVE